MIRTSGLILVVGLLATAWLTWSPAASPPVGRAGPAAAHPRTEVPPMSQGKEEVATLGGGCFWCVEAIYQEVEGVRSVESGYSGGTVPNPTYEQVCRKDTGHVEVVQVHFDPSVIPFRDILEIFFLTHDPTTMDRQGADVGPQYRSVVFYHDEEQRRVAEEARKAAAEHWKDPIVTKIEPFTNYYPAEAYHQDYYSNNPAQPYCSFVIGPKIKKFREKFRDRLKASAR